MDSGGGVADDYVVGGVMAADEAELEGGWRGDIRGPAVG